MRGLPERDRLRFEDERDNTVLQGEDAESGTKWRASVLEVSERATQQPIAGHPRVPTLPSVPVPSVLTPNVRISSVLISSVLIPSVLIRSVLILSVLILTLLY